MSLVSLLILALALAMDATAVAAAKGLDAPGVKFVEARRVALLFGGFQAGMAGAGAYAGERFANLIEAYDHWIAFALLAGIGGKMIYEALRSSREGKAEPPSERFAWKNLTILAIATSVDALAAGITLPLVDANVPLAVTLIGVVTAVLSFAGVYAGDRLGDRIGKKLDVAGGVVLVLIGAKILVEHTLLAR